MTHLYFTTVAVILLILPHYIQSFLKKPVGEIIQSEGSLTCHTGIANTDTNYRLCAIRLYTNFTDDRASDEVIVQQGLRYTNTLRQFIKTRNCTDFTNNTDIGSGECHLMPYELARVVTLCICATNECNFNLDRCLQSNRENLDINPLDSIMDDLTNVIECADASTYSDTCNPSDQGSTYIDQSACNTYVKTHSILCSISIGFDGIITHQAFIAENYQNYLTGRLYQLWGLTQRDVSYTSNQTNTSIYVGYTVESATGEECACAEGSSCNNNVRTCAPYIFGAEQITSSEFTFTSATNTNSEASTSAATQQGIIGSTNPTVNIATTDGASTSLASSVIYLSTVSSPSMESTIAESTSVITSSSTGHDAFMQSTSQSSTPSIISESTTPSSSIESSSTLSTSAMTGESITSSSAIHIADETSTTPMTSVSTGHDFSTQSASLSSTSAMTGETITSSSVTHITDETSTSPMTSVSTGHDTSTQSASLSPTSSMPSESITSSSATHITDETSTAPMTSASTGHDTSTQSASLSSTSSVTGESTTPSSSMASSNTFPATSVSNSNNEPSTTIESTTSASSTSSMSSGSTGPIVSSESSSAPSSSSTTGGGTTASSSTASTGTSPTFSMTSRNTASSSSIGSTERPSTNSPTTASRNTMTTSTLNSISNDTSLSRGAIAGIVVGATLGGVFLVSATTFVALNAGQFHLPCNPSRNYWL